MMTTIISLKLQRQGEGRTHGGGVQSEDQSVILCDSMHPLTSPDLVSCDNRAPTYHMAVETAAV